MNYSKITQLRQIHSSNVRYSFGMSLFVPIARSNEIIVPLSWTMSITGNNRESPFANITKLVPQKQSANQLMLKE